MLKFTIPNYPNNFAGREREIIKLQECFHNQRIIVIAGITGIGKTSLVLKLISKLAENFVDKDFFWISCKEEWNFDNFLEEVNKWFKDRKISSFEEILRDKSADNKTVIRNLISLLENSNIVLCIDNFNIIEDENTKYLIENAIDFFNNSKLIISTRKRVCLSPIHRVDVFERRLDGLSIDDTIEFMSKLLESHGKTLPKKTVIEKIHKTVQGHPFTLKLLSSLYISGELVFENMLYECREFGDEIEKYILDSLFRSLSNKEKSFLKEFCVFNISVSQTTIEKLIDKYDFHEIKTKLVDLYIIDIDSEKKYSLHSILREYLRNKLSNKEKKDLYNKFADYFAEFEDIDMKLQAFYYWFEISDNNKVVEFLKTFIQNMFSQGKNFELLSIIHSVFDKFGDSFPVLRFFKANIYLRWGKLDECIEALDELIEITTDKKLKALIYKTFGEAYSLLSENTLALEYFDKSIEIFKNIDDINGVVSCFIGKADSYRFSGDFKKALEYFEKAKENIENIDTEMEARIYKGLGDIDFADRFFNRAFSYYEKAIELFKKINENFYVGKIRHNQAFLLFETGETQKALNLLIELVEYRKKINDTVGLVYNYSFIGEIYLLKWDTNKAEEYLNAALKYAVNNQEKRGLIDLYINLVRLYIIKKEYTLAEKILLDANNLTLNIEGVENLERMIGITRCVVDYFKGNDFDTIKLSEHIEALINIQEYHWAVQGLFLLKNKNKLEKKDFEYKELFENSLEKINKTEKEFFIKWFGEQKKDEKPFIAFINGQNSNITLEDYNKHVLNLKQFDLFVDLIKNIIIEKHKGELNVLKKRTVANLFIYFINNPGKELSFKNIFETIWKREYDAETDAITVRVNISRLRGVVEPDPKNPKYIINAKESGFYLF
ncbi:MAG: tetratricopeptide repeat protein, partial [Candidatus Muirbacterium halophilum]|nr:tetratricopeptide repeat protein [Candidatus Muirbacterium halophilum]